jgi:vacuolar-type H+-ATPase subunit H
MGRTLVRRRSLVVVSISIVASLASWPVAALAEDGTDLASATSGAVETTEEAAGAVTEEVTDAATESTEQVTDQAEGATQEATQAVDQTTERVTEAANEAVEEAAATTSSLSQDSLDSSTEAVRTVTGDVLETVGETTGSTGSTGAVVATVGGHPVATEMVAVPVTGSSWFGACPHACDQYQDSSGSVGVLGAHGILGDEESFTDAIISTIRSLAMTGLNLLAQMWGVIVLAILAGALIEAGRRRRPVDLLASSRS